MNFIKEQIENKPLQFIVISALIFRLIAAVFSKGYGMHDDHFLVIEASQSWVDGQDYNRWLPKAGGAITPSGHSFFYPGMHYLLFSFLQKVLSINDPQVKMYIVRFLHALFSMIVVIIGYRIVEKLSSRKAAVTAGLLLSLYFFMPVLSVRNLVEVVCIPFLIYGTWLLIKKGEEAKLVNYLLAGIVLGLAFSVRFQTITFSFGFGLALLIQKKFKGAIVFGLAYMACALLVQGILDTIIWGKPYVEFHEYVRYNAESAHDYIIKQWHFYFVFIAGILIPPVSLFLLFGFFREWKKQLLLFLPAFTFLLFHSYFPNKQERFILPILPSIIILGTIGWTNFTEQSVFWQRRKKMLNACWIFFWSLNLLALVVTTTAYTKRSRVEAMRYLSDKNIKGFVVENSTEYDAPMMPRFYLKKWVYGDHYIYQGRPVEQFADWYKQVGKAERPDQVIFYGADKIDERVAAFKKYFPDAKFETEIQPSFIDWLLHKMNPRNRNQACYIYKF